MEGQEEAPELIEAPPAAEHEVRLTPAEAVAKMRINLPAGGTWRT
jgi:hypothetical protein